MDIFVLLFLSLLVYCIPKDNKSYLDFSNTLPLRSLLAITVIFCHVAVSRKGYDFENFRYLGTYSVAVFFFLSGYGLLIQYSKRENYLNGFFTKRIMKVLIPLLIFSAIYLGVRIFMLKEVIDLTFFKNLYTVGSTVVPFGWYLDVIILMYVLFYISFKLFAKNIDIAIIVNTFLIIFYIILATKQGYGFWWCDTVLAFSLGLYFARYRDKIEEIITKYYLFLLMFATVSIFVWHRYYDILVKVGLTNHYLVVLLANVSNIVFVVFFLLILRKFDFNKRFLNMLGKISLEIYVFQSLAMVLAEKYFLVGKGMITDVMYTVVVLVLAIVLSLIYKKCENIVSKGFK